MAGFLDSLIKSNIPTMEQQRQAAINDMLIKARAMNMPLVPVDNNQQSLAAMQSAINATNNGTQMSPEAASLMANDLAKGLAK